MVVLILLHYARARWTSTRLRLLWLKPGWSCQHFSGYTTTQVIPLGSTEFFFKALSVQPRVQQLKKRYVSICVSFYGGKFFS